MENASKALIIAGAILLAILLISLGILIFNQAQDTVSNSGMSDAQKTAFNNQFLKYEGIQKGTVVKSLVNEVLANKADTNNPQITVTLLPKGNGASESAVTKTSQVTNNKTYKVSVRNYTNGVVKEILLEEQ